MGFAEDKLDDYLKKNMELLSVINIEEILNYLPCIRRPTQEAIRQRCRNDGNENTMWLFVNYLRKTDGWVEQFLNALRMCQLNDLANKLSAEYNRHLLPPGSPGRIQSLPLQARNPIGNSNISNSSSRLSSLPQVNQPFSVNRLPTDIAQDVIPLSQPHPQPQFVASVNPEVPSQQLSQVRNQPPVSSHCETNEPVHEDTRPSDHTDGDQVRFQASSFTNTNVVQPTPTLGFIDDDMKLPLPETDVLLTNPNSQDISPPSIKTPNILLKETFSGQSAASCHPKPAGPATNITPCQEFPRDLLKTQGSDHFPSSPTSRLDAMNLDHNSASIPRQTDVLRKHRQKETSTVSSDVIDNNLHGYASQPDVARKHQQRGTSTVSSDLIRVDNNLASSASQPDVARGSDTIPLRTAAEFSTQRPSQVGSFVTHNSSVRRLDQELFPSKPGILLSTPDVNINETMQDSLLNNELQISDTSSCSNLLEISQSYDIENPTQHIQDNNINQKPCKDQTQQSQSESKQPELKKQGPDHHVNSKTDTSKYSRMCPEENDDPISSSPSHVQNPLLNQLEDGTSEGPEETSYAGSSDTLTFTTKVIKDASLDLMGGNTNVPLNRMMSPVSGPQTLKHTDSQEEKVSKKTNAENKLSMPALVIAGVLVVSLFMLWRRIRK